MDKDIEKYLKAHENAIKEVQVLDKRIDSLSPYEITKLQYLYTKVERHAWAIAAWNKRQQKYYEGIAEVAQGQEFKKMRDEGKSGVDAQYLSRISKGAQLTHAAEFEGDYISWRGIAESYIGARNALKDMIKSVDAENK